MSPPDKDKGAGTKVKTPNLTTSEPKKSPTLAGFSAAEKESIRNGNRTAFAALPKNLKAKRATNNGLLNKHIVHVGKKLGLQAVLQSGDPYFVAVFEDTANRDMALEALKAKKFRLGNEVVALTVMPFGVPDQSTNTIWTIRGGYEDTTERTAGGLRNLIAF